VTDDSRIVAVLDATAVVAYARGSVHLGEVIREVSDDGNRFAVPSSCLVEAALRLDRADWLTVGVLLAHSRCVRLETPPGWQDVAAVARELVSASRAVAILWAFDSDGFVLSAEPQAYGRYADRVIGI
jgi:hypothetical protein